MMSTIHAKVRTAMGHVRQFHPEVTRVYFDGSGRWQYTDGRRRGPQFGDDIDVDLLEAASDSLGNLPVTFEYDPASGKLTEIAETVDDVEDLKEVA